MKPSYIPGSDPILESMLGVTWTPHPLDPRSREPQDEVQRLVDEGRKRREAEQATGELRRRQDFSGLLRCLTGDDRLLRAAAASSLGELGDVRAVEPLIAALEDDDPMVCIGAVDGLGALRDSRAIEPLLATAARLDDDLMLRVAEALGRIEQSSPDAAPVTGGRSELVCVRAEIAELVRRIKSEFSTEEWFAATDTPGLAAVEAFKRDRAEADARLKALLRDEAALVSRTSLPGVRQGG